VDESPPVVDVAPPSSAGSVEPPSSPGVPVLSSVSPKGVTLGMSSVQPDNTIAAAPMSQGKLVVRISCPFNIAYFRAAPKFGPSADRFDRGARENSDCRRRRRPRRIAA
jgi:hypothetical protein